MAIFGRNNLGETNLMAFTKPVVEAAKYIDWDEIVISRGLGQVVIKYYVWSSKASRLANEPPPEAVARVTLTGSLATKALTQRAVNLNAYVRAVVSQALAGTLTEQEQSEVLGLAELAAAVSDATPEG